ncbi:MAG: hypothetical protein IT406_03495 [Candidatus Yanofskybacteria bacterium]|nr:hypothetical protein [Candidatus Yanofskybacteria bacterium]
MMRSTRFLSGSIVLFAAFLCASFAAAAPVGVTVAPIRYAVNVDPGASYEDVITVANPNDFVLRVQPEFQDFRVTDGNTIQWVPSDVENPYRMVDWIEIDRSIVTLKPHEEARIPFTIRVPRAATAGGRYAAIFFTAVLNNQGENVGAVPRVGALVILNVNGDLTRTGNLTSLDIPRFVAGGPVSMKVGYLNTGTTHYESNVSVSIRGLIGKTTVVQGERRFVYPNIERTITAQWSRAFPFGVYRVTATAVDGSGVSQIMERWVVAVPFRLVIPAALIFFALFFGLRWFRSKFKIVRASV